MNELIYVLPSSGKSIWVPPPIVIDFPSPKEKEHGV